MEILQLKYFCDAARTENFSRTAKKYLVPTSDISQSVKRLERELECELFNRSANKVTLNDAGRRFYQSASEALELLDNARSSIGEADGELDGEIKIICLCNRRTVTQAIERFIRKHPAVSFVIRHRADGDASFDLLISDSCPYEYGERRLLCEEDICVAMSKSDPLAEMGDFSVEELEGRRLITMTSGASLYKITQSACEAAGFTANIAIQTDDPLYLRKYVELGLGVAFVPTASWRGLFNDGVILKPVAGLKRRTYAYLPRGGAKKRAVAEFLKILSDTANADAESSLWNK